MFSVSKIEIVPLKLDFNLYWFDYYVQLAIIEIILKFERCQKLVAYHFQA